MKQGLKTACISFLATAMLFTAGICGYYAGKILNDRFEVRQLEHEIPKPIITFEGTPQDNEMHGIVWDKLQKTCPGIVGWLSCPDTNIDYPIMQSTNNSFFLNHLPDGTYNQHGSLFMDYRNKSDFTDANTLIYGHAMKDKTMLHDLILWKDQEFAQTHPVLYLDTEDQSYQIHIFSARQVDVTSDVYQITFDGNYADWLLSNQKASWISTDHAVPLESSVITFSTCTANGEHRFVVQGYISEERSDTIGEIE